MIEAKVDLLISNRAEASCLIVLLAVDVRAVVERLVPPPYWPSPFLILKKRRSVVEWQGRGWGVYLKVPVEAGERPVLLALVLQEQRALVHAKLLQVPATQTSNAIQYGCDVKSFKQDRSI